MVAEPTELKDFQPRESGLLSERGGGGGNFNAIRISLASPDQIRSWSYGEVKKPETLNYRTFKPEKDGLFCERIFGPVKDWECYCGKYKKARNQNITCDKCGVLVTRARVRRRRMGHIKLAAPVAHSWFSKGAPSRIGLITGIPQSDLDKVVYFAQYIITSVNEETRESVLNDIAAERDAHTKMIRNTLKELAKADAKTLKEELKTRLEWCAQNGGEPKLPKHMSDLDKIEFIMDQVIKPYYDSKFKADRKQVRDLKVTDLITENQYRDLRTKYGNMFTAQMGAEAIMDILKDMDLKQQAEVLKQEIATTTGQRNKRLVKRYRIVKAFLKSGLRPEWMLMTILPVLPPDLRPMVRMGGVRFASSSLNDLYRRVVSRNNRLAYLLKIQAPEIMIRNEKRMLQEAIDVLIDSPRRGASASSGASRGATRALKPLTDLLRGKQGRFRQNLLGKRVDYSGRAVIVSGPELSMGQCGLPRYMALELFKPFLINALINKGHAQNIKSAKRMIDTKDPLAWGLLEEVTKDHPVLLNRAPTLHRLGIQAFYPVLIDGSAIRLHPLVCTAFNADFDGDQMAVHVPLTQEAQAEARTSMLSKNNLLAPRAGSPIVLPTLDMILGLYYLTSTENSYVPDGAEQKQFASLDDARLAYDTGRLQLREIIKVRNNGENIETTAGRIIFNQVVLTEDEKDADLVGLRVYDRPSDRSLIEGLVNTCYSRYGNEVTSRMLDRIKSLGFEYVTKSGNTISIFDMTVPQEKKALISGADKRIDELDSKHQMGLITEEEKRESSIEVWTQMGEKLTKHVEEDIPTYGGIYFMARSGAKGNIAQIKQMVGMRGLMADPKGRIIEMPIRSAFVEGLSVYEYFISTHGARKGLADTALRTADSGYLTRRLVDVAQDVIIMDDDCETPNGFEITGMDTKAAMVPLAERIVSRYAAEPIAHPKTGEVLVDTDTLIGPEIARQVEDAGIKAVKVRSPLDCTLRRGICAKCYGASLASNSPAIIGEAMGVIAAQSIGEPGTQLTMRTFHTGGIVSQDITAGLPRVVEIFEARRPKGQAVLTEIDGTVTYEETSEGTIAVVRKVSKGTKRISVPSTHALEVKTGQKINTGDTILSVKKSAAKDGKDLADIVSDTPGTVNVTKAGVSIAWEMPEERRYPIPANAKHTLQSGDSVQPGDSLTEGPKDPNQILRINGPIAVERNLTDEIQAVYRSQGVSIHDKHVEVIIRQMLRKVRITSPGDTDYTTDEVVDRLDYESTNAKTAEEGKRPAKADAILMGVTRASLSTPSFLSAASFQETSRVLTDVALRGTVDLLKGLKENVIIGHLIPARLDQSEAGKARLQWDKLEAIREEVRQRTLARKIQEQENAKRAVELAKTELADFVADADADDGMTPIGGSRYDDEIPEIEDDESPIGSDKPLEEPAPSPMEPEPPVLPDEPLIMEDQPDEPPVATEEPHDDDHVDEDDEDVEEDEHVDEDEDHDDDDDHNEDVTIAHSDEGAVHDEENDGH